MLRAGSRPPETIELAALPFRGAAAARLSDGDARLSFDHRRGWAVVDQTLRRRGRPNPLLDDCHDLENARAPNEGVDPVADLYLRRGFGCPAVHADVAATARGGRLRTALVDPHGPQPDVYPRSVDMDIVAVPTDGCWR
jgi:hypothetical protein